MNLAAGLSSFFDLITGVTVRFPVFLFSPDDTTLSGGKLPNYPSRESDASSDLARRLKALCELDRSRRLPVVLWAVDDKSVPTVEQFPRYQQAARLLAPDLGLSPGARIQPVSLTGEGRLKLFSVAWHERLILLGARTAVVMCGPSTLVRLLQIPTRQIDRPVAYEVRSWQPNSDMPVLSFEAFR